mmetsp:Transcript_34684/g.77116  ORF Transcript_34684/g.77116 Transcript_34684/m.77116 type:complete len:198 (-) Transcript_34684:169-762(-)
MSEDLRDLLDSPPQGGGGGLTYEYFEGHHKRYSGGFSATLSRFNRTAQGYAYWRCLQQYSSLHTFIGFIDLDEFLVVADSKASSLDDVLREYEGYGGVSFHWRAITSSGHDKRPDGGVVDAYTSCLAPHHHVHRQIKTFVNTRFKPLMISPHRALFGDQAAQAMERGQRRAEARQQQQQTLRAPLLEGGSGVGGGLV